MFIRWMKCQDNIWCSLANVNLKSINTTGVYFIWKPGNPSKVIQLGQGDIAERLQAHLDDPEITQYGTDLLVTWASVPNTHLDGVEHFLANKYPPLAGRSSKMFINWVKCQGNAWCYLANVNLPPVNTTGVYFIWKPGNPSKVVRLGQGYIAERLQAHLNDPEITQYGTDLLVTWAAVPNTRLDGVAHFLALKYPHLVGVRYPDAEPIAVNIPA